MVDIIDGKAAGDGIAIASAAIPEGGMRSKYRKALLELGLQRLEILVIHLATTLALQRISYLRTNILHHAAPGSLVEELGGANLHHPAHYTIGYSETHRRLLKINSLASSLSQRMASAGSISVS